MIYIYMSVCVCNGMQWNGMECNAMFGMYVCIHLHAQICIDIQFYSFYILYIYIIIYTYIYTYREREEKHICVKVSHT